jgi:hypothetical protein
MIRVREKHECDFDGCTETKNVKYCINGEGAYWLCKEHRDRANKMGGDLKLEILDMRKERCPTCNHVRFIEKAEKN